MAAPNHVPVSTIAAGADQAAGDDDKSFGTIFRKSAADILGAVGFGGIIGGFSALATYATTTLAPASWYAGIAANLASPEGLLLTAAVSGVIGIASMVASTTIKTHLEAEQHAREKPKLQKARVVIVPVHQVAHAVAHTREPEAQPAAIENKNFTAMIEKRREELAAKGHQL